MDARLLRQLANGKRHSSLIWDLLENRERTKVVINSATIGECRSKWRLRSDDSSSRGANSYACQSGGGWQSVTWEGACAGAALACRLPSSSSSSPLVASAAWWSIGRGSRRSAMSASSGRRSSRKPLSSWSSLPCRPCFSGRTRPLRFGLHQGRYCRVRRRSAHLRQFGRCPGLPDLRSRR